MRKIIIGVMGPGENATEIDLINAYNLGELIAQQGWVLLTGGRNVGVMERASQGAKANGGLTVGILPGKNTTGISEAVDIAIVTDMGNGRNNVNVLSSDIIIACGMGLGTASEVALALKNGKPVLLLTNHLESQLFFTSFSTELVTIVHSAQAAIETIKNIIVDIELIS